MDRVSERLHGHWLSRFLSPGMEVFDAGCGWGKYTTQLARLETRVTVGDISASALQANREHLVASALDDHIEARHLLDIGDLSCFPSDRFDATVCLGGTLGYVDRFDLAFRELIRVTRPGGLVIVSVGSRVGLARCLLLERLRNPEAGDVGGQFSGDDAGVRLFTSRELHTLFAGNGVDLVHTAATNCLTTTTEALVPDLGRTDPDAWRQLLEDELAATAEPGALDSGTHILAVGRVRHRRRITAALVRSAGRLRDVPRLLVS